MKLRGWHIDGFGIFNEHVVEDLPDGLTVLHGPNEAGKSTLLAFIRRVLFGYPDGRSNQPLYPPLRGGRHGGRLLLETDAGACIVERLAAQSKRPRVTRPDGSTAGETALRQLLGGADEALFHSIFAFSLLELQSFKTLTAGGVRERILAAGIVGAGRSASQTTDELEKRAGKLFKPRARTTQMRELDGRLREVEQSILTGKREAIRYGELLADEQRLAARVDALRDEETALRAEQERLGTLIDLWPGWHDLEQARAEAARVTTELQEAMATAESTAAVMEPLEIVDRSLPVQLERLEQSGDARLRLRHLDEQLENRLRELGTGWNADRIESFDGSLSRQQEIGERERRLDEATDRVNRTESDLARATESRDDTAAERDGLRRELAERTGSPDAPPTPDVLAKRAQALRHLRASRDDRHRMHRDLEAREAIRSELERERRHRVSDTWLPPAVGRWGPPLVALIMTIWMVIGLTSGRFETTPLVILGLALLAIWILRRKEQGRAAAITALDGDLAERAEQIAAIQGRIDMLLQQTSAHATRLGLSTEASSQEIEECGDHLRAQQIERRSLDELEQKLTATEERLKRDELLVVNRTASHEQAGSTRTGLTGDWHAWLEEIGLPGDKSPRHALAMIGRIGQAHDTLNQRNELADRIGHQEAETRDWEERARRFLAATGDADDTLDSATGPELIERLTARVQRVRDVADLDRRIAELERQLTNRIGEGEAAEALRGALATGELETWRSEQSDIEERLTPLVAEREQAIRDHTSVQTERRELEQSAAIAELELERATLLEEIERTAHDWCVLSLASGLIAETLQQFKQTRQPAVLADAGRLFGRVTDGRYVQVVQESDEEAVTVIDRQGRRKGLGDLSRGTAEQLYLCLRLGLTAEFSRRSTELPLVMDDVLVNFDPARARHMVGVLAEFAREHQVLFFTCHPGMRDLLGQHGGATKIELDTDSGGDGDDGQQGLGI